MKRSDEIVEALKTLFEKCESEIDADTKVFFAEAFAAGVGWADENPNFENAWHSSEEDPKKNRYILIEVVNTLTTKDEIGYYVEYTKNWVVNVMKTEGFKCRWAYIKDLLPKN